MLLHIVSALEQKHDKPDITPLHHTTAQIKKSRQTDQQNFHRSLQTSMFLSHCTTRFPTSPVAIYTPTKYVSLTLPEFGVRQNTPNKEEAPTPTRRETSDQTDHQMWSVCTWSVHRTRRGRVPTSDRRDSPPHRFRGVDRSEEASELAVYDRAEPSSKVSVLLMCSMYQYVP